MLGSMPHIYVAKLADSGVIDPEGEMARLRAGSARRGRVARRRRAGARSHGREDGVRHAQGRGPAREGQVTEIGRRMKSGSLDALQNPARAATGSRSDRTWRGRSASPSASTMTVLTPEGTLTPMGMMPRARTMRVVGMFALGLYEYDSAYAVVSLPVGLRLMGKSHPDFVQLRVNDVYEAPESPVEILNRFGSSYMVQDWADMNQPFFSALWLEKMAISITIGLIVIVAALNIIASLVLMVMEKSKDIAILKTMGASARSVTLIFMLQGVLIGAVGTVAGAILGRAAAWVLDHYRLVRISTEVYQISYVPFRIETDDFLIVVASAMAICFFATIYPSRQAARLDPAEALRYG